MAQYYRLANASDAMKLAVWAKGRTIAGYDPREWRRDACGWLMRFDDHGDRSAKFGWEIDHIIPVSKGGTTVLANLQPLHWENNAAKGDNSVLVCATPRRAA